MGAAPRGKAQRVACVDFFLPTPSVPACARSCAAPSVARGAAFAGAATFAARPFAPPGRLARRRSRGADAARLVDQRQRLGETRERIGVGGRLALMRRALDDGASAVGQGRDDRPVEFGGARPGAVVLGEQIEFLVAHFERDFAAVLERVAFDKADDVGDVLARAMRHHRDRRLAGDPGRIALLRPADQVADPAGLVARGIGRPRPDGTERSGRGAALRAAGCGRQAPFWAWRPGAGAGRPSSAAASGRRRPSRKPSSLHAAQHSAEARECHGSASLRRASSRGSTPSPDAGKPGTMSRHERDHDPRRTTRRRPPHRPPRCRDLAGGLCRHPGDAVSCRPVDAAPRNRLGGRHRARAARRAGRGRRRGRDPRVRQLRPEPRTAPSMPARSSRFTSRPTGRTRASAGRCCSPCSSGWSAQGCGSAIIWVLRDNPGRFFYRRLGGREVRHKKFVVGGKRIEAAGFAWDDLPRFLETAPGRRKPGALVEA